MEKALDRKYRPRKLSGVVGQEHIKQYFKNAVKDNKISHAYLLTGKRGIGKTTIARIIALIVNCDDGPSVNYDTKSKICKSIIDGTCPDVWELDGASNGSVDNIREIIKRAKTFPMMGRKRVFIIDEAHRLSGAAVSALLKILEEPPESSMFILATTEPNKILNTIQSRCQRFNLRDISIENMMIFLGKVAKAEKATVVRRKAIEMIARRSGGSLRDALKGLEAVLMAGDYQVTADVVEMLIGTDVSRIDFCSLLNSIISKDYKKSISLIKEKTTSGIDPVEFFNDLLEFSHDIMVCKSIGSSDHLSLSESEEKEWESALESNDLDTLITIHSHVIDYTGILQSTMRPDLLLDTFVIDIINKLED